MSLVLNFGSKGICVPHDFIPGCSYIFECLLIPIVHWTGREFVSHRDELSNHFPGQSIIISFHWTFVSPQLAIGFWDRFIRSGPLAQAFSHSRPSQHSRLSRQATGQAVPNRFNWSTIAQRGNHGGTGAMLCSPSASRWDFGQSEIRRYPVCIPIWAMIEMNQTFFWNWLGLYHMP